MFLSPSHIYHNGFIWLAIFYGKHIVDVCDVRNKLCIPNHWNLRNILM